MAISEYSLSHQVFSETALFRSCFSRDVNCFFRKPEFCLSNVFDFNALGQEFLDIRQQNQKRKPRSVTLTAGDLMKHWQDLSDQGKASAEFIHNDMMRVIRGGYNPDLTFLRVRRQVKETKISARIFKVHADRKRSRRGRYARYYSGAPMQVFEESDVVNLTGDEKSGTVIGEARSSAIPVLPEIGEELRFANGGFDDIPNFFHRGQKYRQEDGIKMALIADVCEISQNT